MIASLPRPRCLRASIVLHGMAFFAFLFLPLTVMMYGRVREGATPVLNAVSLLLMVASALLAPALLREAKANRPDGVN